MDRDEKNWTAPTIAPPSTTEYSKISPAVCEIILRNPAESYAPWSNATMKIAPRP